MRTFWRSHLWINTVDDIHGVKPSFASIMPAESNAHLADLPPVFVHGMARIVGLVPRAYICQYKCQLIVFQFAHFR